jgi:hypothetical protein
VIAIVIVIVDGDVDGDGDGDVLDGSMRCWMPGVRRDLRSALVELPPGR